MAAVELALPSSAAQLVATVIQAVAVAAQISDHYLRAGGKLSSSVRAFHPGERTISRCAALLLGPGATPDGHNGYRARFIRQLDSDANRQRGHCDAWPVEFIAHKPAPVGLGRPSSDGRPA